jgi:hypothetical protein
MLSGQDIEQGQDSFLDIVSNIVGILIILVMVAGVRAKSLPPLPDHQQEGVKKLAAEVKEKNEKMKSMNVELSEISAELNNIERLCTLRQRERDQLVALVHEIDSRLQESKEAENEEGREYVLLKRELLQIEETLEQIVHQKQWVAKSRPDAIVVESLPTPVSRIVDEKEAHFRIAENRISYVPFSELIEEMADDARANQQQLRRSPELTETVGPIEGYRLRYTVVRKDLSMQAAYQTGRSALIQLAGCEVIPTDMIHTESLEEALRPDSRFQQQLSLYRPDRYAVTFWVYPDSFEAFRELKKLLFEKGYQTAGRPLPSGAPIAASPHGSRSAAQ